MHRSTATRAATCGSTSPRDELPDLGRTSTSASQRRRSPTRSRPAHRMTAEQWSRDIDVNLTGAFRVVAGMPARDAGARLRADRRRSPAAPPVEGLPGPGGIRRLEGGAPRDDARPSRPRTSAGGSPRTPSSRAWSRPRRWMAMPAEIRDRLRDAIPIEPVGRAERDRGAWWPTWHRRRPDTSPARRSESTAARRERVLAHPSPALTAYPGRATSSLRATCSRRRPIASGSVSSSSPRADRRGQRRPRCLAPRRLGGRRRLRRR